jgi:hypothetical protein
MKFSSNFARPAHVRAHGLLMGLGLVQVQVRAQGALH